MKVWVKTKSNNLQHNINIANAAHGFNALGLELINYESIDEIYDWVTGSDIVLDYISQVNAIFNKFGIVVEEFNYPKEMEEYLGRKVWYDTINHINSDKSTWGVFIKPVKEKQFTGRVINSLTDLIGCGGVEDYDVICSEALTIKAEWRCFVVYDKIVGIQPYGFDRDYSCHYDYTVVKNMLESFKTWENRPMGCSIDIGVTEDNKTVLIEVNDGYSLAAYGLNHLDYAKLISARWSQLLNRADEVQFI